MGHAPGERSLAEEMEGRPFQLVGINGDNRLELARRSAAAFGPLARPVWCGERGPEGPIPTALRVRSWPWFVLVDAEGVIRWRSHRFEGLPELARRLVAEAEAG